MHLLVCTIARQHQFISIESGFEAIMCFEVQASFEVRAEALLAIKRSSDFSGCYHVVSSLPA